MTPNDIIVDVKRIAQDNGLLRAANTYSASVLLAFVNQILKQTAILRPDLFTLTADVATNPNVVEQTMPADAIHLVNVLAVKDGGAVLEVSREAMDQFYPQWRTTASGTPVNYMRHPRNPNRFYLYPKPAVGVVLTTEYAQTPPTYTLNQPIALIPDSFQNTLAMGVLMLISGIENPTADLSRYQQFQSAYEQALGVSLQAKGTLGLKENTKPSEVAR
jgi:hypothetical protein